MLNLGKFLPYKIATLSEKLSDSFAKVYKDKYGLSVPQWRVIAHLAEQESLTAKEICVFASLDKSTTSRAVKQLLEREIITSVVSSKDKRAHQLSLTCEGLNLYNTLSADAKTWQDVLLDSLCDEDREIIFKLIDSIERNCSG